jgi:N-acetylmuramic acid 6-phosphate etherase
MTTKSLGNLTTEAGNAASADIDAMSPLELVRLMNAEDANAVAAVATAADAIAKAIAIAVERLRRGGRIVYVGAGTSGRLGVLDAAECPPTFNSDPSQVVGLIAGGRDALVRAVEGAEDDAEQGARDLDALAVGPHDFVVGIAASGRTPYVLGALQRAKAVGAATGAVACNADSDVAAVADVTMTAVVGPEVLSGSTRLKAGTATKLILNALTTGAMVGLGKTYGNLLVDLRATNFKLRDRAERIVAQAAGVDRARAGAALSECDGEVKTAIVSLRRGVAPEVARRLLARADGRVRLALAEPSEAS